jgi:hypothetical protein
MAECPIDGCARGRKPNQMMCWPHWRRVPRPLNKAIFETYANGPREEYLANRSEAIRIVNEKEAEQ